MNEWLSTYLTMDLPLSLKLIDTVVIILLLWLLRLLIGRLVIKRIDDVRVEYNWRKSLSYGVVALGLVIIGRIWLTDIQSLATSVGLITAGLTIALQGPITNFAAWIFIIWRRPFEVSDRIEIGDHTGDVIDVRIFEFSILELGNWVDADQSTGRILHIPNGMVFSRPMANFTKGFAYIWHEIPVHITFESDWEAAKATLLEIVNHHDSYLRKDAAKQIREAAHHFFIRYTKLTPIVYTRVDERGVRLTVRYLTNPRQRRSSEQAIWEDILRAFKAHPHIEFAYPTQRFYHRSVEVESQPVPTAVVESRVNGPGAEMG